MTAASLSGASDELELLLRATLLIGAAWAAAAALRRAKAPASARHTIWLLGIAALLALPLLWWLAPALRLPILAPEAAVPAAIALAPPAAAAAAAGPASSGAPESWGYSDALLAAWAIGAILLLVRIAVFRRMLKRLWRDAVPAQDAAWESLLSGVSREMHLSRRVELRISRGPIMPMTWGTLAPKVLLPAEAGAWPPEQRRLVLLHELAHVARRDSLSRSAASLACALYWFHPGAWFAARQMRLEQEHAADDRVLNAGAPARNYALSLVDLARGIGERSRRDPAAAMAGMCQLERRLVSITTPGRRELPGAGFLALSTAMAAAATFVVAAGVPVRPAMPSDPLRAEPAAFASDAASGDGPARTEAELESQAQTATRAETDSAAEGGSLGGGGDSGTATFAASEARASGRILGGAGRPDEARPQTRDVVQRPSMPAAGNPTQAPAPARRLAAYGPSLPRADADDQSARIPAMVRQRRRGDSGPSGRGLPDLGIRLVPQDGDSIGRPGLAVSLVPGWP